MDLSNILIIFRWWFVIFLLGTALLPLTFAIFKNFFDKGYIFSKILGIAVVSYTIFLLGILHLAPFSFLTSTFVVIIFALINLSFIFSFKDGKAEIKKDFLKILKEDRKST